MPGASRDVAEAGGRLDPGRVDAEGAEDPEVVAVPAADSMTRCPARPNRLTRSSAWRCWKARIWGEWLTVMR